ncbi:hypothetical protein F2Q68_00007903 [Brassica cretica]|uniref:Transcription repressor n=1 Tax=Brassica cretica TaxID=69181 RepID=A0A8S9L0D7_BRACR|nr:hypothetical protein F2Q68_00007903 [Brassica cretica]
MNQKMGTHKFRFSAIMPHSWLYKLKGISRSSRKRLPSSPKHLSSTDASSSRKLRETLLLSSSVHHPQAFLKAQALFLLSKFSCYSHDLSESSLCINLCKCNHSGPSPNSHVSLTSSWNHRSKSTVGSSSEPVSSSPSDQNYGFSREPESKSVDIKALNSVDSEDPSISDNSSPVLVETAKQKTCDTRTQQKLKKPKAGSSGIRIRENSPKIARRKTKGRTSYTSKRKGNSESFAIVLTSVDPEKDFRESMVEMIVENKMKEQTDLEDLLACYLSLNSSEYHDIIIKAFEKTWFHLTHLT